MTCLRNKVPTFLSFLSVCPTAFINDWQFSFRPHIFGLSRKSLVILRDPLTVGSRSQRPGDVIS